MTSSTTTGLGSHSGVTLNTTTGSGTLPTTTLASSVPKQNFFLCHKMSQHLKYIIQFGIQM